MDPTIEKQMALAAKLQEERYKKQRPYYKESTANEVKKILDRLHASKIPQRIMAEGISAVTLRLQYYNGAQWLADHDPKYAHLYASTVCRTYSNYIELHIKPSKVTSFSEASHDAAVDWRTGFLEFIETAITKNDKFHRTDISLTPDEISWAEGQLAPLSRMFVGKFTEHEILVIRYAD